MYTRASVRAAIRKLAGLDVPGIFRPYTGRRGRCKNLIYCVPVRAKNKRRSAFMPSTACFFVCEPRMTEVINRNCAAALREPAYAGGVLRVSIRVRRCPRQPFGYTQAHPRMGYPARRKTRCTGWFPRACGIPHQCGRAGARARRPDAACGKPS